MCLEFPKRLAFLAGLDRRRAEHSPPTESEAGPTPRSGAPRPNHRRLASAPLAAGMPAGFSKALLPDNLRYLNTFNPLRNPLADPVYKVMLHRHPYPDAEAASNRKRADPDHRIQGPAPPPWHVCCWMTAVIFGEESMSTLTATAVTTPTPKPLYQSLFVQVLAALLLGIVVGMAAPDFAISLKILSDTFLKLISMIVAPIVFCVVVHGIAGAGDLKKVGRVGVKALVYFEVMTTVALVVGLILAFLFGPGHGMNIDTSTLDGKALSTYADNAHKLKGAGVGSFLVNIIPTTSIDALARNDVLQVLFFAILFGVSLALVGGEKGERITSFIDAVSTVLFRMMGLIVRTAPLGVLGAVAYTVGQYGVGSLKQLVSLVALFYVAVAIFVLGVLGSIMALAGLNIIKFLNYLREELTIVLATASSDAVLPQIMRKLERMGVKDSVVGLVIPTGYSFNLDAFSIYLTLAVVFIAQATNTPLSLGDLLLVLGVSLITSKGAHGVPGSAIVILAATLNAVPSIPVIGLVLVLSIDWFIGMARALGNLIGNCVATVVVAAWEGDLDRAKAKRVLDGEVTVDVTAG
jgi:aerobic C4-dicarboxylate transport protein